MKYFKHLLIGLAYLVLILGLRNTWVDLNPIETITITTQQTSIKFAPLLAISVAIVLIFAPTIIAVIVACWNWLKNNIQIIIALGLVLTIVFDQLVISVLTAINTMIRSNADQFIENNLTYIRAFMTYNWYTGTAIILIVLSVIVDYIYKKSIEE